MTARNVLRSLRHVDEDARLDASAGGEREASDADSFPCTREQRVKEERAARKLRSIQIASQILKDACGKHPRGQTGVALALGVSTTRVGKWCDPEEESSIPTHHLLALAEACPAVFADFTTRLDQHTKAPKPPSLPATLDESVYRARCEIADVDRLLVPGNPLTLDQLRVLEDEAEEAAAAANTLLEHARTLIARRAH